MENKYVGLIIIALALVFFLIVMSFNNALDEIVNTNCTHGESCPMHVTLKNQQIVSYSLIGLIVLIGAFITFFIKDNKKDLKKISEEITNKLDENNRQLKEDLKQDLKRDNNNSINKEEFKEKLEKLSDDEKKIVNIILSNNGTSYQSDLIKETKFSKVQMTRLLDKIEGKGMIERKRRGMTNVIILKQEV